MRWRELAVGLALAMLCAPSAQALDLQFIGAPGPTGGPCIPDPGVSLDEPPFIIWDDRCFQDSPDAQPPPASPSGDSASPPNNSTGEP